MDDDIFEVDFYTINETEVIETINERLGTGRWERVEIVPVTDLISTFKIKVDSEVSHLMYMCKNWVTFGMMR